MIVKKIAIITGKPFGSFLNGSIGLEEKPGRWYGLDKGTLELQFNSINEGYRKATLEEIKSNWDSIKEKWDPQPGDVVRITQLGFDHENDYVINEIYKGNPGYWKVSYLNGSPYNAFNRGQMVLSPNHGWEANSTPVEGMTTLTFLTEEQFKANGLWKTTHNVPIGWTDDGSMDKYMGTTITIPTKNILSTGMLHHEGWIFEENDYVLGENLLKEMPKDITEPQPRWKVGDYVTFKSRKDCENDKYSYGGICQEGYKGEIISYGNYGSVFNCFTIEVTSRHGYSYTMLECEFEEWDNPNFQNSIKPEPVIDKKVEFTIKDGVLRFDGHEVRVGDTVSFRYTTNQKEPKEIFISNERVANIGFDRYTGDLHFKVEDDWRYINKIKNFVNHGQSHSRNSFTREERALTMDTELDSLKSLPIDVHPVIKGEKYVSDYQQKPVTLYKSKTKISLKPINLTK